MVHTFTLRGGRSRANSWRKLDMAALSLSVQPSSSQQPCSEGLWQLFIAHFGWLAGWLAGLNWNKECAVIHRLASSTH